MAHKRAILYGKTRPHALRGAQQRWTLKSSTNYIAFGKAPRRGERGQNMLCIEYMIVLDGQSIKKISFGNFYFSVAEA